MDLETLEGGGVPKDPLLDVPLNSKKSLDRTGVNQ